CAKPKARANAGIATAAWESCGRELLQTARFCSPIRRRSWVPTFVGTTRVSSALSVPARRTSFDRGRRAMFLRNAWYVAAWGREIGRTLTRRILLNEPVVLYRTEDGRAVALEDRCCHRRLPLSDGKLVGDRLQCHYHGLEYEPDGRCVFAPGVARLPPQARVKAYPLAERWKWLWIWMGDPALADPAKIEDFHWLDDPAWGAEGTYYHVKGDYRLIIENLLDLTHLTYVHDATIGNYATANAAETKFEQIGSGERAGVRVTRWMIDTPPPPTYVKAGGFVGNVDRWQIIDWTPPANVRLDVGATPTGTGA